MWHSNGIASKQWVGGGGGGGACVQALSVFKQYVNIKSWVLSYFFSILGFSKTRLFDFTGHVFYQQSKEHFYLAKNLDYNVPM
jgi:hypothetical protein